MQQVLHLLYLNHRTSLKYPENQLMPHPHRKQYRINNHPSLQEEYGSMKPLRKSVQIHKNRQQSLMNEESRGRKRKLSRDQVEIIQKYSKRYKPEPEEEVSNYLVLPKISNRPEKLKTPIKPTIIQPRKLTTAEKKRLGRRCKRKFKKWVNAIIFINRLQKKVIFKLQNFNRLTTLSQSLPSIINKMINKYYCEVLEIPLLGFSDNLKKKIRAPQTDLAEDVIFNLIDISKGLKKTSIRKDLLSFLTLITINYARVPHDFFTDFELVRLDFSDKRFQLINMIEKRVRMVVGIFLAIKLFCNYIINYPWQVPLLGVDKSDAKKMQPVILAYSSYFYYSTISFFEKLPKHNKNYLKILQMKGVEPVFLKEQNDYFYDGVALNYSKQMKEINSNLEIWINRVSTEVIRNRKNFK